MAGRGGFLNSSRGKVLHRSGTLRASLQEAQQVRQREAGTPARRGTVEGAWPPGGSRGRLRPHALIDCMQRPPPQNVHAYQSEYFAPPPCILFSVSTDPTLCIEKVLFQQGTHFVFIYALNCVS